MKTRHVRSGIEKTIGVWILTLVLLFSWFAEPIDAHGGEDHGDAKPKVTTNEKGNVSSSARIGKLEVLVKHQVLEPDVSTAGHLFVTEYQTNSAFDKATVSIEIENANGATIAIASQKAEQPGIFNIKIPALSEGTYTMRVNVTYDGATDTATFPGVSVAKVGTGETAAGISWLRSALLLLIGGFVLILFAGLFFVVWRTAELEQTKGRSVSA